MCVCVCVCVNCNESLHTTYIKIKNNGVQSVNYRLQTTNQSRLVNTFFHYP